MGTILDADDLSPFADIESTKAEAMIADVEALAFQAAPCLSSTTDDGVLAAAKAILRGVVLRWHESGVTSYASQTMGPAGFPLDTQRPQSRNLWTNEEEALQNLCGTSIRRVRQGWLA